MRARVQRRGEGGGTRRPPVGAATAPVRKGDSSKPKSQVEILKRQFATEFIAESEGRAQF